MAWDDVTWPIDLQDRPTVLQTGIGVHRPRTIEHYRLSGLWCLHLYRYRATVVINGSEFPIRPGHASVIPPDAAMEYRYSSDIPIHVFAHFALPASRKASHRVLVPAMQNLGKQFEPMWGMFEEAVGFFASQPRRTEVCVWELLWRLTDRPSEDRSIAALSISRHDDPVRAAQRIIEQRLGRRLSVAQLAEQVGLSHNHLTRRFRAALGTTVIGYIQDRRARRARHLLIHSTLPIKSIAAAVGIPDPHLFNKTMRRRYGKSPRAIRAGGRR